MDLSLLSMTSLARELYEVIIKINGNNERSKRFYKALEQEVKTRFPGNQAKLILYITNNYEEIQKLLLEHTSPDNRKRLKELFKGGMELHGHAWDERAMGAFVEATVKLQALTLGNPAQVAQAHLLTTLHQEIRTLKESEVHLSKQAPGRQATQKAADKQVEQAKLDADSLEKALHSAKGFRLEARGDDARVLRQFYDNVRAGRVMKLNLGEHKGIRLSVSDDGIRKMLNLSGGTTLLFLPRPVAELIRYEIRRKQEIIPTKIVVKEREHRIVLTPVAHSPNLKVEFVLDRRKERAWVNASIKLDAERPPHARDLPIFRLLSELAIARGEIELFYSIYDVSLFKLDLSSVRLHGGFDELTSVARYIELFLEANFLLKRNGLITANLLWAPNDTSAEFMMLLEQVHRVYKQKKPHMPLDFTTEFVSLNRNVDMPIKDGQVQGEIAFEESLVIGGRDVIDRVTIMNSPKIRMTKNGKPIYFSSFRRAFELYGDAQALKVQLSSESAQVRFKRSAKSAEEA